MTPAQLLFWKRVQLRASRLQPDLAREVLRAFQALRNELGDINLLKLLETNQIEKIISEALSQTTLRDAFLPVRERIRDAVREAVKNTARDLPKVAQKLGGGFDILNPKIIEGIQTLESKVITTLEDGVRDTVRQIVERGLRDGEGPKSMARALRDHLSLAANQEAAVHNFERMLEEQDGEALTRELRDRRFDGTLKKAFAGDGLTSAQIEKMTAAYRSRMENFNAETIARTASLDSQKLGQKLTWEAAIERGDVDGGDLTKTWVGVMDDRERPSHVAMEGETVPFDQSYSNGQMVPGESEYNCRCISIVRLTRAA